MATNSKANRMAGKRHSTKAVNHADQNNGNPKVCPKINESALAIQQRNSILHEPGTKQEVISKVVDNWGNGNSFILSGCAGIGKTVLASKLYDVVLEKEKCCSCAFHLFGADEGSLYSSVENICAQLCTVLPKPFQNRVAQVNIKEKDRKHVKELFRKLLIEPALAVEKRGISPRLPLLIILDALDECEDKARNQLAKLVRNWNELATKLHPPCWMKIFATSRKAVLPLLSSSSANSTVFNYDDENNMKDVRMCVKRLLKNSFNVEGSQLESWTNKLTEKTNGLFLYFRFLSEMLQDSGNLTDEAVNMLPVGLEGMYSAHCLKLLGTLGREKYERALGAVLACRGPLPEIVWRKVTGVAENETGYIELQKSLNNLLLF